MKTYCGAGKTPKNSKKGTQKECLDSGQVRLYGVNEIDKNLLKENEDNKKEREKKKKKKRKREKLKVIQTKLINY